MSLHQYGVGGGVGGDGELLGELLEEDRDAAVAAAPDEGRQEGVEGHRGDGGREGRRGGAEGFEGLLGEASGGV